MKASQNDCESEVKFDGYSPAILNVHIRMKYEKDFKCLKYHDYP